MPRQRREESGSKYYHIMVRGINKDEIFAGDENKLKIKNLIKEKTADEDIEIIAYCIMDNHMHLIIKADKEKLSAVMKKINISYASYYNKKMNRVGHVFQDRFKSEKIETDEYLVSVVRYVHNNPIAACMEKDLNKYKWSSFREYIKKAEIISTEQKKFVLNYFNNNKEAFEQFHGEQDSREYLDQKEDIEEARYNQVQKIIESFLKEKGIIDGIMIKKNIEYRDELIEKLLTESKLTHRKIAELLEVSRNVVHGISRRNKNRH